MRAAIIDAAGEVPVVGEAPEPTMGPGQALLAVRAAALNPVDLAIGSGRFYRPVPPPPFVPGAEVVGTVERSERCARGTRVWALCATGGFAERVVADDDWLVAVPEGIDDAMAAAIGIAGLAGWMPVRQRGALVVGERVLVLGAGSVVGQTAIRAAVLGGASHVVAAARSEVGRARGTELGAHATADLGADDVPGALRAACPDGVDLVIDPIWGPALVAALAVCRPRARIVQIGNAAGPLVEMPAGPYRGGELDLRGFSVFNQDRAALTAAYGELAAAVRAGEVAYDLDVIDLDGLPEAWRLQAAGAGGRKSVVRMP